MSSIKDYLDEAGVDYYNYLLKEKQYISILELYRKAYPESTSIRLSFLGIKMCSLFEVFCLENKIDIITMKGDYSIRFDSEGNMDYLSEKINNLRTEIKLLTENRLPQLERELIKLIEERKIYKTKLNSEYGKKSTTVIQHLRYGTCEFKNE